MRLRRFMSASLSGCTTVRGGWHGSFLTGDFKTGTLDRVFELVGAGCSGVVLDCDLFLFEGNICAAHAGQLLQNILHAVDASHAGHSLDFYDFCLHIMTPFSKIKLTVQ